MDWEPGVDAAVAAMGRCMGSPALKLGSTCNGITKCPVKPVPCATLHGFHEHDGHLRQ
jgi:hypothetical protein